MIPAGTSRILDHCLDEWNTRVKMLGHRAIMSHLTELCLDRREGALVVCSSGWTLHRNADRRAGRLNGDSRDAGAWRARAGGVPSNEAAHDAETAQHDAVLRMS